MGIIETRKYLEIEMMDPLRDPLQTNFAKV